MGRAGMKSGRGYSEGGRGWSEEWEGLEFKRGHAIQLPPPNIPDTPISGGGRKFQGMSKSLPNMLDNITYLL